MSRYFFEIAYKGTNYSGWQRQKSVPSIQQTIEDSLTSILKTQTKIHGCGRTDAGVHASQYFFHVNFTADPAAVAEKLRKILPPDISIINHQKVSDRANAQKHATQRTYEYYIHQKADPFLYDQSYFEPESLDIDLIKEALKLLAGKHDFRNFCKSPDKNDNCICILEEASIQMSEKKSSLVFTFVGNRFLHHMIRLLIGNLLKIGKATLTITEFKKYLDLEATPKYFDIAYPQGLYLSEIAYSSMITLSPSDQ